MQFLGATILLVLDIFFYLLVIRLVVSWIQAFAQSWTPRGPVLVVLEFVFSATDPPIKAVRRVLPPLRIGSVALDLGLIVVFIVIWILRNVTAAVFF